MLRPLTAVPLFEMLEQRALRSATLVGTELRVAGSGRSDLISVYYDTKNHAKLDVKIGRTVSQFNASSVSTIRIDGLGGDDRILVNQANGAVRLATKIYGGVGDDSIVGGAGRDRVYGGVGDDSVSSGLGSDIVYGEAGDDSLRGDAGNDAMDGGLDDDIVDGDAGNDRCSGGDGNDDVNGDFGDDSLNGGNGDDSVNGDAGDDSVLGGSGHDHFWTGDESHERPDDNPDEDFNDDHGVDDAGHDIGDDHGGR